MDPARPLRDVFADLVGDENARQAHAADPEGFLQAQGHADLPDDLVNEAIVNFADTAPVEVAEHLAPFVMAHGPVPLDADSLPDGTDGLDVLATAPVEFALDEPIVDTADLADHHAAHDAGAAAHDVPVPDVQHHVGYGQLASEPDADDHGHGTDHLDDDYADLAHAGSVTGDPFELDFGHGDFGGDETVHTGHDVARADAPETVDLEHEGPVQLGLELPDEALEDLGPVQMHDEQPTDETSVHDDDSDHSGF